MQIVWVQSPVRELKPYKPCRKKVGDGLWQKSVTRWSQGNVDSSLTLCSGVLFRQYTYKGLQFSGSEVSIKGGDCWSFLGGSKDWSLWV